MKIYHPLKKEFDFSKHCLELDSKEFDFIQKLFEYMKVIRLAEDEPFCTLNINIDISESEYDTFDLVKCTVLSLPF